MNHITTAQVEQQPNAIMAAPKDDGILKTIAIRPKTDERQISIVVLGAFTQGLAHPSLTS